MYFAHSLSGSSDQTNWQPLKDHLNATALLSASFAAEFGAERAAHLSGLLHDLGKYTDKFQKRLAGGEPVDHSTAGAIEIRRFASNRNDSLIVSLLSYVIAGHHAGLSDFCDLNKRFEKNIESLDPVWESEINASAEMLWPKHFMPVPEGNAKIPFQLGFLGRMLFSCLVDADFKDTERFYAQSRRQITDREWPDLTTDINTLIVRFNLYMAEKQENAPINEINRLRAHILATVRSKAKEPTGLYTLTVPTGGGKTLTSLAYALEHAKVHGLRRIVYAIPFTSIIDQTANIFRDVMGNDYILEHHSNFEDEKIDKREQRDKLRLAMEDWAAPVIVTTNVQLFESLFANRPSRCRKLHNLARSVIVLDEAQTLPHSYLLPCMAALDELARNYGCTILLCTATQPALDKRGFQKGHGLELEGRELAPNPAELAHKLQRAQIFRKGELDDYQLVEALAEHEQGIIIVNSRRHALDLFRKASQSGLEGMVHLTTRQYAEDRRLILARVRQDLLDQKPCRLIATSLVEAGVDLDFPRVWRAETGLEQIIQAAGRCNREGKRALEDSIVTVFKPKEHSPPPEIKQLVHDFSRMADSHPNLFSPDAIKAYFAEVYWRKGPTQLDMKEILNKFGVSAGNLSLEYKTVAESFRFIESGLMPIIVAHTPEAKDILDRLENTEASPGKAARELQSFIVQVPPPYAAKLIANTRATHHRTDLWGKQFLVLNDESLYRPDVGLMWEDADILGDGIF